MSNAISSVYLCSVPITPVNQIDFTLKSAQSAYFESKIVRSYNKCSYIPRSGTLKVTGYIDDLNNCNYGYYDNIYNGTSKRYYFWIVKKDYSAKGTTTLTVAIDEFQTWLFDFKMQPCIVEREHVTDDTFGVHTYSEDFELGDYVTLKKESLVELTGDVDFFIGVSDVDNIRGSKVGKLYSGLSFHHFRSNNTSRMDSFIQELCNNGKADCIAFIFSFPSNFLYTVIPSLPDDGDIVGISNEMRILKNISSECFNSFTFNGKTFSPRNKKCFCYPFNFMTVKNASGGNVVLKYELFDDAKTPSFVLDATLSPVPEFTLTPNGYDGKGFAIDDSISTSGFGLCSWNNDNFSNWFANNANTLSAQSANAITNFLSSSQIANNNYAQGQLQSSANDILNKIGLAQNIGNSLSVDPLAIIGGGINAVASYGSGIINNSVYKSSINTDLENTSLLNTTNFENTIRSINASVSDAKVQPNTCKGDTSSTNLDVARGTNTFFLERTCVKPEYIEIVDNYFQMFGYKVNTLKKPVFNTRSKWNYLKTANCCVGGNIPRDDVEAINGMFNNGLTVWHDEKYMFNYLQDNDNSVTIVGESDKTIVGEV